MRGEEVNSTVNVSTRFNTLSDWLAWQETLHPSSIDLGLERVEAVLQNLGLARPPFVVITVAGTNGKGSCVAMLEAILRAAGYRVGAYTSPHLLRYNERIRIDGREVDDAPLCGAFGRIDAARGDISLTYFEFGTLAAIDLFARAGLDVALMEVGLGGRLDAVNVFDPDAALVTTVDLDHQAWLGSDREAVGREKAGIFRRGRPAVCGDADPPLSLVRHARLIETPLFRQGVDFGYRRHGQTWDWWGDDQQREGLPLPALRGAAQLDNASAVLMVLHSLARRLPVGDDALRRGLSTATLPGRFQIRRGLVPVVFDVAHNPQAATELAANLTALGPGRNHGVFGMLADKERAEVVSRLSGVIDLWYPTSLDVPRGVSAAELAATLQEAGLGDAVAGEYETVANALGAALKAAAPGERVVVFGSFHTVAGALLPAEAAGGTV